MGHRIHHLHSHHLSTSEALPRAQLGLEDIAADTG
jgi:hypothetical protein